MRLRERKKIHDIFSEYGGRITIENFNSSVKVELLKSNKSIESSVSNPIKRKQLKLWNEIMDPSQNRATKIERRERERVRERKNESKRVLSTKKNIENPLFRPQYSFNMIQNSFHQTSQILSNFTLFVSMCLFLFFFLFRSVSISSKCLRVCMCKCVRAYVCV